MERGITRKGFLTKFGAWGALFLLGMETGACSSETSQEKVAGGFVNALINGDIKKAVSFLPPNVSRTESAKYIEGYLRQMSNSLEGCKIDSIYIQSNLVGALLGAGEEAVVTFKRNCGESQIFGVKMQSSSMNVGLSKVQVGKDKYDYYVNLLLSGPTSVLK